MIDITIEKLIKEFGSYYLKIYENIEKSCQQGNLDFYGVRCFFRHLPLRYDSRNTYPEEINKIVDRCFKTLYDYCIKKSIIASDTTYEDFYEGQGLYDDSYSLLKRLNAYNHDSKQC